jgi:hypothetical protein
VRRPRGQEGARPRRGRLGFAAGILLMGASFLVYPAYPVLAYSGHREHRDRSIVNASIGRS